jgi:hypothetical protein
MKFIFNSTFSLNVSREGYDCKESVKEALSTKKYTQKLAFKESEVSVLDFINATSNGYAFCGLFDPKAKTNDWGGIDNPFYSDGSMKIRFKTQEFFKGSQAVFVDIDETGYKNIQEYLDLLSWQPTVTYTTFSDSDEDRRFRLIYVFDEVLDKDQYVLAYKMIADRVMNDTSEIIKDNCGMLVNQYMNGTGKNAEIHSTNIIYSWNDIVEEYYSVNKMNEMNYNNVINNIINNSNNTYNITYHTAYNHCLQKSEHLEQDTTGSYDIELDSTFYSRLKWIFDNPDQTFYGDYFFEPELFVQQGEGFNYADINSMSAFLPEGHSKYMDRYFKLFYNVETVLDGSKRRKRIFANMCLRRLMRPEASPEQIAYCAYVDIMKFMDNSDKVFDANFIKRNVKNAFKMSFQEIKDTYAGTIDYLANNAPKKGYRYYFKKGDYSTGKLQTAKQTVISNLVMREYDPKMSVKENISYLQSIGIDVPERTLYKYIKNAGVDLNDAKIEKQKKIMSLMNDDNCTVRKMKEILKKEGIKCSNDLLSELIKNYKNRL